MLMVCRFIIEIQEDSGRHVFAQSTYLVVTPGILADQYTMQERGIHHEDSFKGITTFAGQYKGADSAAGGRDASGKVSVLAMLTSS